MGGQRTDRILIGIALLILLLAGSAFYFDGWMWGNRRNRGDKIGFIDMKSGDVRMKFDGDLKWNRAARGQDLNYNDSIFAGKGAEAQLQLGQTKMTVTENTLIVLRREKDVNFLNLNYGTLLGKVAKNEKVVIDTGNGSKPIELTTTSNAQIVIKKTAGKTQLDVVSGQAQVVVDGKKKIVEKNARVVLDDKAPSTKVEQVKLLALNPLKDQTIYSEKAFEIPFNWAFSTGRQAQSDDKFTLEFSGEPSFKSLHATKVVTGALETKMSVSRSLSLYYRVRGPQGQISQTEKVNFVRLERPIIVKPIAEQKLLTPPGQNALVEMEFKRPERTQVWFQVATDAEFKQIVSEAVIPETRKIQELAIGSYFLRARGDFGSKNFTGWTETVPFQIEPQLEQLRLSDVPVRNKILIPNRNYPSSLYGASDEKVMKFLASRGFLKDYFPFAKDSFDQLKIKFDDEQAAVAQDGVNWPERAMRPGKYGFTYRIDKLGFQPSPISEHREVEIADEAPRAVGTPLYGDMIDDTRREVRFQFTPLLFAKTYDVEFSKDPRFSMVKKINVPEPIVATEITNERQYWRARARDKNGRVISGYSTPEQLTPPEPTPKIQLAEKKPEVREQRKIASTEDTLRTRAEKIKEEPWEKNGWWTWLGSGYNYVQYGQSTPRGSVESKGAKLGSQYLEAGYTNSGGYGGVFSYKNTPGNLVVSNAVVDRNAFSWSTISIEALMKRLTNFKLLDTPVVYGLRGGVQQHKVPYLNLDADTNLNMRTNEMTTGSLGVMAEWMRNRWTYHWLMRYQVPFQSKAQGANQFSITPTF
ncbi:MAG: hypothetical protein AB7H97_20425, partial [Pseudobdellovibrionaceae bacterium]